MGIFHLTNEISSDEWNSIFQNFLKGQCNLLRYMYANIFWKCPFHLISPPEFQELLFVEWLDGFAFSEIQHYWIFLKVSCRISVPLAPVLQFSEFCLNEKCPTSVYIYKCPPYSAHPTM